MAEKQDTGKERTPEDEVWSAISAFEQILEALPEDRSSLEALSHAYAQIGDHARAKDYLVRLTRVVLKEGDARASKDLLEKLRPYVDDDAEVRELVESIGRSEQSAEEAAESPGKELPAPAPAGDSVRTSFRMADELAFAWNLLEAGQLTQDEYAQVVQDLSEMALSSNETTVSLLHVLQARGFKNLEQIIGYVATECGTPVVSLANFEVQHQACTLVPFDFMVSRGVLPFELVADHALVIVLNPYDRQLRTDVESLAERPCHFFVTLASEFDQGVERVRALLNEGEGGDEA